MANVKQGYEGLLYHGAAGATATTLITNAKDITVTRDVVRGNTTVRGNSTEPPIETESVSTRRIQLEWSMINDSTDAVLTALKTAAAAGTAVALRFKDHSSGKGPDGDFTLSVSEPYPLSGEQTLTFTATPNRDHGRSPQAWV